MSRPAKLGFRAQMVSEPIIHIVIKRYPEPGDVESLTEAILRFYRGEHPGRTFEASFNDSTAREEMEIMIFETTED
jgi:hypothetical protein